MENKALGGEDPGQCLGKTLVTYAAMKDLRGYCLRLRCGREGIIFKMLLLLLGDEVLAVFQALDLELVALGPLVDVLHIVCEEC